MKKGRILGVLLAAAMAFGGVTGAVGTRSVKADGSSNYLQKYGSLGFSGSEYVPIPFVA